MTYQTVSEVAIFPLPHSDCEYLPPLQTAKTYAMGLVALGACFFTFAAQDEHVKEQAVPNG